MSRHIKLQPKHQKLAYGEKQVPELRISGAWLEKLGFKIGEAVSITAREELLIIQPVSEQAYEEQYYKEKLQQIKKISQ